MSQLCKKISITLAVFENRVETNANMKINFHVWTFTEQVHKRRKKKPVQIFPWVDKKKYQVSILPTSETVFFWSISFDVFTSDLAPTTWSLVGDDLFWSLKSITFEGSKKALLFVTMEFFRVYHICNGTCPQEEKKIEASTHCCFWKTNLKMTVERRQNHLRQSQLIFQKTFRTLPQKWRNFQGCIFFLVWGEAQNENCRNSFRNDRC